MIIRIFSSVGNKRINVGERDSVSSLFVKTEKEFQLSKIELSFTKNGDQPLLRNSKHIDAIGLKHGDILYLKHSAAKLLASDMDTMDIDGDMKDRSSPQQKSELLEDEIDQELAKMDGRIHRQRNEQYCRHNSEAKCIHCVPLEPYDEAYLEHCDPPIKFMSFQAYRRKLAGGQTGGKFVSLTNISCRIRPGCRDHPAWPEGVCTKCQPPALTLDVQQYRHVDNIMFENKALMDDFLDSWRLTGNQRVGIMFGYYTTFNQAPLGIKAVVSAIYEPPQKCTRKSVAVQNLSADGVSSFMSDTALETAKLVGLQPVGWIFTDLVGSQTKEGTVKHFRGTVDTYFLTAQECITAAYLQNLFPNRCQLSSDGYFGSKFVTVVVTGDQTNNIHFEGYQVSNQCMALVKDEILVPTYDAPELGYIRESSSSQYVPDVFCKQKDEYGNTITRLGRPLPVEFMLVHMSVAFPLEEHFSLRYRKQGASRFPIENREAMGELQDFDSFKIYMDKFQETDPMTALSNLHLLWFLFSSQQTDLGLQVPLRTLLLANSLGSNKQATSSLETTANKQFRDSHEWLQILERLQNHTSNSGIGAASTAKTDADVNSGAKNMWSCVYCTFDNDGTIASCQMCGLPKS